MSAQRASTGALVWHAPVGGFPFGLPTPPLAAGGEIVVNMSPGSVMAYRISDGSVAWYSHSAPRSRSGYNSPLLALSLASDVVYAAAAPDSIAAWRTADGTFVWQSPSVPVVADPQYASGTLPVPEPVPAADAVYFSAGQSVRAVRVTDGSLLWSSPVLQSKNLYTPPVVDGSRLFVATHDGSIYALDADTGAVLWHAPDPDAATAPFVSSAFIPAPPIVRDGIVYDAAAGGVRALDALTGSLLWHLPVVGSATNLPPSLQVANGVAVVVTNFTLSALDARSGAVRWNATTQQSSKVALLHDDTAYTLSADYLTAWHTSDGTALWTRTIPPGLVNLLHVIFDGDAIYVSTSGMTACGGGAILPIVSAVRASDGALLWQKPVPL